jgi:hypothetical protein
MKNHFTVHHQVTLSHHMIRPLMTSQSQMMINQTMIASIGSYSVAMKKI